MLVISCSLLALSQDDVLPAVYLCTNNIAPDHENKVAGDFICLYTFSLYNSFDNSKLRCSDPMLVAVQI